MPIEICEEFAARLAKVEEDLAERAAEFPFVSYRAGSAPASPVRFLRLDVRQSRRMAVEQNGRAR